MANDFSCWTCTFPAEIKQGGIPPSCFSSPTVRKGLFSAFFFLHFSAFLLCVILLFKVAPGHSAEVLCDAPQCKKAVMCLMKRIRVRQASVRHELWCCWPWVRC